MPKRTFQPHSLKVIRKQGFRARMESADGREVINRRRKTGRKQLTISDRFRKLRKAPNHRRK